MEPTDKLDAPNRRLPESRVKRVAKRKSASRTSSIFLVNPSLFSTSRIERVGWRRLWTRCFGASQGQSWGQFHTRRVSQPMRLIDCLTRNDSPDTLRSNCRNWQKERLLQEVRGPARCGRRSYPMEERARLGMARLVVNYRRDRSRRRTRVKSFPCGQFVRDSRRNRDLRALRVW